MRDDFSPSVKRTLADRVAWRCSSPGCDAITVGPGGDENKRISVGEAAHIHAAAPGGPRYNPLMTPEERSSIENGIWLCRICAKRIDADCDSFSAETLKSWKASAEAFASQHLGIPNKSNPVRETLIQIGFSIVFYAKWISATSDNTWKFKIGDFIYGDFNRLYDYFMNFSSSIESCEKFVVVESQGDGRLLSNISAFFFDSREIEIIVCEKYPVSDPNESGTDLAISDDFDLFVLNGDLVTVCGLECAKQTLRITLSSQFGEWVLDREHGSLFHNYLIDWGHDRKCLERLFRLEVARLATVPLSEGRPTLPVIKRILLVDFINVTPINDRLKVNLTIEWGDSAVTTDAYTLALPSDPDKARKDQKEANKKFEKNFPNFLEQLK